MPRPALPAFFSIAAASFACGEGTPPATSSAGESAAETTTGGSAESESGSNTDTGTETDTGETGGECGDGVLDPPEACDDGNLEDGDGCTSACELGPCGFEWVTRELVLTGAQFEPHTPLVVDGEDLVVAHQLGEGGLQSGIVRAAKADGLAFAAAQLEFGPGDPEIQALAVGPGGELFLARSNTVAQLVEIHRLTGEGEVEWSVSRPSLRYVPDLELAPGGELVLVDTIDTGPMDDEVELVGLDPADGSELWAHSFGGPTAPNGFSSDRGAALALDEQGRAFVGYDQYLAWDTSAPAVVAFAAGGAPEPLWETQVVDMPGRQLEIAAIDHGVGIVALAFQRWDGSQKFWLAALDAETGAVQWVVERDDFDLPNTLSSIRGVAIGEDRVLATGTWVADVDGLELRQGYVLGLGFDGSLVCVGTLDDHEPGKTFTGETWLPFDLLAADGGYYLSGYVNAFNTGQVDLLLARVR
jgi:cysteine-rich repeat protein